MKEYRLEGPFKNKKTGAEDNVNFILEAGPIVECASFDHAFGTESRTGMTSIDIEGTITVIEINDQGNEIGDREMQQGEFTEMYPSAYVILSDEVESDFSNGAFDE